MNISNILLKSLHFYPLEGRLTDLEKISTKQSNLIKKLRDEGRVMETMLRKMSKKYRKEVGTLCQDKEQVTARLSR